MPTRILIELRPRNNESWCHVQSLAMNPRVRTTLPLQQLLVSLITYLDKKWQFPPTEIVSFSLVTCKHTKIFLYFESCSTCFFLNVLLKKEKSSSSDGKENVAVTNEQDDVCRQSFLRLAPREGVSIVAPSIRSGEFVTSSNISLMAYEKKFAADSSEVAEHLKQVN